VTLYDRKGFAVAAKVRRNEHEGDYVIDCPMDMGIDLKTMLIALSIFWVGF